MHLQNSNVNFAVEKFVLTTILRKKKYASFVKKRFAVSADGV